MAVLEMSLRASLVFPPCLDAVCVERYSVFCYTSLLFCGVLQRVILYLLRRGIV
jgi:hypothetical protein